MARLSVTYSQKYLDMWNEDYLAAKRYAEKFSDDPNTKVGCLVHSIDNSKLLYTNRLPNQLRHSDWLQSSDKKIWMVHAEQAAITDFAKHGWFIQFSTMLVTHHPCVECVKLIISAGISKLISPSPKKDPLGIYNFEDAKKMIEESAVEYIELEPLRPINLI